MYPWSSRFRFEFTGPAHKTPGSGSDMHWNAWGDDGALYVVDDDGHNFGGPWSFCHLIRVTGTPPDHSAEVISRFPGLNRYTLRRHLYVNGALCVGSRLYVAAYEYESLDPANRAALDGNRIVAADGRAFNHIDAISHHGGVASLMVSDDHGKTFTNYPVPNAPLFLGPRFAGLAFVAFGPGYSQVPERLGPYVYAISNDEGWECGSHVFLARVPREQVLNRQAWEFYGGRNFATNEPAWVPEEAYARPILTDPGHVGHPSMTYVPALDRFLLSFGSDAVPKSYAFDPQLARDTYHRRRELQMYEAPTPWGPWALVHYDPQWEGDHIAYLPQIPPCWLAADGMSGTLMFSGDYRMASIPWPGAQESWYAMMTRPFRLLAV